MAAATVAAGQQAPAATTPAAATATATAAAPAAAPAETQGGTIRGTVVAGTAGKPGGVPLPGVEVTATNTLTGKKYTGATDIDGVYVLKIPRNGRYVVKAELTGFAAETLEVRLTGVESQATAQGITIVPDQTNFGMQLASRAAAAETRQAALSGASTGTQSLSLSTGDVDTSNASANTGNAGASMPSLASLGDSSTGGGAAADDAIAVNGQAGQTNGLAGISEDDMRQRIQDAVERGRANGTIPEGSDPTNAIVSMLGGMMSGGPGGGGPGGGGSHGSRGGGGGSFGSGGFRNFNPAQPHGSIFYQGGNSALNSAPWSPSLLPLANPGAYSNRFGASIAGSPYIPGLTKPNTKEFVFINLTGQKNLNAYLPNPARVPTLLERSGDFSQSTLGTGATAVPVTIYDPKTGQPIPGSKISNDPTLAISPVAQALLNSYYPAPNIPLTAQGYNYQTISNAGSNNVAINTRFVQTLGQSTGSPFSRGGGSSRHSGGSNAPPSLRQNINVGYNYSHSATDNRNIFLPLGGATETDGNALSVGYTIGYGRLSNSATLSWNRNNAATRNYFTDTATNPTTAVGITVPNQTGGFANPRFYNGLPTLSISNFQTLSNTTPSDLINQTISYSDFVSWRKHKHNFRFGIDVRRVHADTIGGNNPLGTFTFSGYATASPADQAAGNAGLASGDAFADFLLGLPQSTALQAGLYKTYLRENTFDWYALDDWRLASNLSVNVGLRYDYYGPYSEKDGHMVNLAHDATFSAASITPVMPGQDGYPNGLVNPDHTMYSPRIGLAYRLKNSGITKEMVLRGGYGVNYNTGQYAVFAKSLSHQAPFAATQTNTLTSGCTTTTTTTTANMTLANGFNCSTAKVTQNYAVDKNYRLGMVQIYNLNLQKTIPLGIVLNFGYNGTKGSNLDVVGSPNASPAGVTTPGVAAFDYEESGAWSHSNQLVISAQKRQQKGIALGFTYTYSHSIDNASGVGGAVGRAIQNFYNLAAEEGNSSYDQRHNLSGNWLLELPFGPNRAYFNKGGFLSHALDGFSLSGSFTFATGNYLTPEYNGNAQEASSGNTYTQRPNRVAGQSLKGPQTLTKWFNTAAFAIPAAGQYGTASPGSIEGPGTVSTNAALSRTVQLGETRSFEARVTATNIFNTVQYSGIDTNVNDTKTFGEVTSSAAMRSLQVQARFRF